MFDLKKFPLRLIVIGVIFGIGLFCNFLVTTLLGNDPPPFSDEVMFTELYMCAGPDTSDGTPQPVQDTFLLNRDKIFVCGYLETPVDAYISTVWFSPERTGAIKQTRSRYQEGYFYSEFYLEDREPVTGDYSVQLIYAHDTIGELNFKITSK